MNTRKDKQLSECDSRIKEIRVQLGEQLKCFDQHTESRSALIGDVQEFFKRKSEIEAEYARKLDLLSEKYLTKQRNLYAVKKEQPDLSLQTPVLCWFQMLEQCQRESKDHNTLSTIYLSHVIPRLQAASEDITRLHKKTRDIAMRSHEDLLTDLKKLYQAMQLYQVYWAESAQAENKFKQVEKQFEKRNEKSMESPKLDSKVRRSTSFRKMEKLKEKRMAKFSECKLKSVKARNEYILQLESTNAALNKYYGKDVLSLLETMSIGYHGSFQRMWKAYCNAENAACNSRVKGLELLTESVDEIEPTRDRTRFMDNNNNAFACPPPFPFCGHPDDEVKRISLALPQLHKEADKRCSEIERTIKQMNMDQEELKKTVDATMDSMHQLAASVTFDLASSFVHTRHGKEIGNAIAIPVIHFAGVPHPYTNKDMTAVRGKLLDVEAYHVQKFEEHLQKGNQMHRLETKRSMLETALGEEAPASDANTFLRTGPPRVLPKPSKRQLGGRKRSKRTPAPTTAGHFSSNLQLYLKESGRSIPLVVESCIRVINLYGMHHQGIFRVPGSHQDITDMKASFEAGDDPISDREDDVDINSVAGLLKLYFRQLDEKLFPQYIFEDLNKCAHISNVEERVVKIRQILLNIPESVLIVMRYLFAFLNHLSQNSDENMMDAYNIAVCFGPTLLPVPDNFDPVTCQANVNEVIKTIVVHHDEIFPTALDGPMYEKVMTSDDYVAGGARTTAADGHPDNDQTGDQNSASQSVHSSGSEDEDDDDSIQMIDGYAKYDYKGRSDRELTFFKGDQLTLYRRVSEDWWEGNYKGRDGLVPHAYIVVQDYVDGTSDVLSSRTESEVSLDSAGTPQSPSHRNLALPASSRRSSSEANKSGDTSKLPTKTKSLDRYNNVQDYIRQQKVIASKAASKAGLVNTGDSFSRVSRSGSVKSDKSSLDSPDAKDPVFASPDIDPASMTVAERIARFKRTSSSTPIDPDTIQKKTYGTLPRFVVQGGQHKDIDDTMKNALDQLQALEMHGPPQPHKGAPDVVLDTLESRGHRSSSDSPVHSNASTLSSNDGRVSDKANTSPQSSGQWKAQMKVTTFDPKKIKQPNKNSSNNNNNSTSHYQVPTHRYQGIAAMAGHDFSSSAPNPVRPSSHEPMRMSYSVKNKYGVKKTAL